MGYHTLTAIWMYDILESPKIFHWIGCGKSTRRAITWHASPTLPRREVGWVDVYWRALGPSAKTSGGAGNFFGFLDFSFWEFSSWVCVFSLKFCPPTCLDMCRVFCPSIPFKLIFARALLKERNLRRAATMPPWHMAHAHTNTTCHH